jgi:hypothetical protein
MSIGMPASVLLLDFGEKIYHAFDRHVAYHVGSSLSPGKKFTGWRDVDVRLILPNDVYEAMHFGDPAYPHSNAKWVATCMAWSCYGRHLTALPIDFQVQQQSDANRQFSSKNGHYRSALFALWHTTKGDK